MTLTEKIVNSLHCRFRKYNPDPKITARLYGTQTPVSYVKGLKTKLRRPEGIVISPSGDLMATVNCDLQNITFYPRDDSQKSHYASTPVCTVTDPELLAFIHDGSFTPDGNFFAVAARDSHSIVMYALHRENNGKMTAEKIWSISGDESSLSYPHSVALHPSGKLMAVANQTKYGITLYHGTGSNGEFDSKPFQTISEEELNKDGIAPAHELRFTPDGKYLAVNYRIFYLNKDSKGEAGLAMYEMQDDPEKGVNPKPLFFIPYEWASFLHSVAFNPAGDMLALVVGSSKVEFFSWQPEQKNLEKLGSILIYNGRFGEGPKGVDFTRDGKQIAVTTEFDEILFYDIDQMEAAS